MIDLRIDGLTNTQKQALQTAAPLIRNWLRKIFRVYRRATPEQKAWLIEHNTILARIVEGLGEDA